MPSVQSVLVPGQRSWDPQTRKIVLALMYGMAGEQRRESLGRGLRYSPLELQPALRHHRVLASIASVARSHPDLHLPDTLGDEARAQALACLRQSAIAHEVIDVLDQAGTRPLVIKGLALAAAIYGDFTRRGPGDLDILVAPSRISASRSALTEAGGVSTGHAPHTKNFTFKGLPVEVHHRLDPNPFVLREPHAALWERRARVPVGGRPVDTLSRVDSLLLLCTHGSRDGWPTLRSILDVAALESQLSASEIAAAHDRARLLGADLQLSVGLALAGRLRGGDEPTQPRVRFITRRVWRSLAASRDLRWSREWRDRSERNFTYFVSLGGRAQAWAIGQALQKAATVTAPPRTPSSP